MNIKSIGKLASGAGNLLPDKAASRYSLASIALRLFITCWLVYAAHFATNTVREIYPALSLGDHLSFDVSEYWGLHPDIFQMPKGGVFINNNPGASILGAVPYAIVRPGIDIVVERVKRNRVASPREGPEYHTPFPMRAEFYSRAYERGLDVKFALAAGVMQASVMAPISALSVVVMFFLLIRLTPSIKASLLLAFLYAFATPLFYRTAQLNHNLLIAHLAFFAFVLLWRPWDAPERPRRPRYLLAGLLVGWTVVLDYSGLIVVLALGLYALFRWLQLPDHLRSLYGLARFGGGVAVCGLVLMAYQWSSFGHPLYSAQRYMPPSQFSQYGYSGLDWPSLDLFWRTAFDPQFGLFAFAPLLLAAMYLPGWFSQYLRIINRQETVFIIIFVLMFFLFASANRFGYMQFNTGVRHIVPVTPFLFLLAAGVLLRLPVIVATVVGVATTYWSWCLAMVREVGDGHELGVIDAVASVTFEGFRLPWLTTLELLNYVPRGVLAVPFLLILGVIVLLVWRVQLPRERNFRVPVVD